MHRYICRANVDHFVHLLEDANLPADRRAMITKLLIEEEDKFGRDLEQLQFAETRVANGRDRVNLLRQKLESITEQEQRANGERLLTNFEDIQRLLEGFCHHLRAKVLSPNDGPPAENQLD